MCNTGRGSSLWMDGSTSRSGKGFACMSCFIGYPCLAGYLLCIDHLIGRSTEASQNGLSNCEITVICFNSHQAPVRIGVIFKHLRKLMDSLLERKLANPKMNLEGNFKRTSNWLLNEWIIIFIVSQYIYTHTFSNSLFVVNMSFTFILFRWEDHTDHHRTDQVRKQALRKCLFVFNHELTMT